MQRRTCPIANGLSVFNSSSVDINRVLISKDGGCWHAALRCAGWQCPQQPGAGHSGRWHPGHAGFQARHGQQQLHCRHGAIDSVSSIGYVPNLNESITVTNNTSINSGASGVSVEGHEHGDR